MKIVVINESEMRSVFTMKDAIEAAKDALKLYSAQKCQIPLRANLAVPEHQGQSLYMPGYAAEAQALGVKIVSVYSRNAEKGITNVPSTMVLLNPETGQVCALMDGTCLTRLRTGAVSGAATEFLARPESKSLALFGTGGQAASQLEAVLCARKLENVRIYSLRPHRAAEFAKRMSQEFSDKYKVEITAAASPDEAIQDADIITCATTSKTPVFQGKLVKKGCHINGVGSYMPDMQEVDEHIVANSRVYVDTREGVISEAGDLIIPITNGSFNPERAVELGEVIGGNRKGRESSDELTFFKSTGTAVLDVVTARRIYEKALEKGICNTIEL